MSWEIAITLQVIVSAFMTIFTRYVTLSTKRAFFMIGVFSYIAVGIAGLIISLVVQQTLPHAPPSEAWVYLIIEGICIPAAWLAQYKVISYAGAANAMVAYPLNTTFAALLGIWVLAEPITPHFLLGGALIMTGAALSMGMQADTKQETKAPFATKFALLMGGAVLFGFGMLAEKLAINNVGAWNYTAFGWGMQTIGAILMLLLFGRGEFKTLSKNTVTKGLMLGFVTSIAGVLYVHALSIGSLSATIVAAGGKIAITVLLAAIFLHERNNKVRRVVAFLFSLLGLWLIIG